MQTELVWLIKNYSHSLINDYYKKEVNEIESKITNELLHTMYNEYKNGKSTLNLEDKYGFKATTICSRFTRAGYELRNNKDNSRKYNINHNYFEEIDTEDKAYWLGFIYADGYITKNNNQKCFGISISEKDVEILYKLNKCINSNYEIKNYTTSQGYSENTKYSRLLITSDKIFDNLLSHGVFENKSNNLKPPLIKNNLIRHFIRGYIDGDGSIYKTKNKYGFDFHVNIIGTNELLTYIHNYLKDNKLIQKDLNLEKRKQEHKVSNIRYGGNNQTYNILKHLYNNSKLYLTRKYNIYLKLCELVNSRL